MMRVYLQEALIAIRRKYPNYEPIAYDTIAGIVVIELALNHIEQIITK